MKVYQTSLPGVYLIEPLVFADPRGFFMETWQAERYRQASIYGQFVQDNYSYSIRGVLRGLHYQLRHPQGKLVCVLQGEVFDVAVDIRRGSPTFGRWVGELLSGDNHRQLYIPPGFAHGFCVLSEAAHFLYKCLYKINFIFFAKILDDLFHILDQMSKAGIRPKFDPFIFHKTPQYLYQIQFGRILRKVENR